MIKAANEFKDKTAAINQLRGFNRSVLQFKTDHHDVDHPKQTESISEPVGCLRPQHALR
jgi:hypothetical protein